MNRHFEIWIFFVLVTVTASCGSEKTEGADSSRLVGNTLINYGVVRAEFTYAENDQTKLMSEVSASFRAFSEPLDDKLLLKFENQLGLHLPHCEVVRWGMDIEIENDLPSSKAISAGEAIVITNTLGTWAELQSTTTEGNEIIYRTSPGILSGSPGEGATVDVPGAEYTAFNDISLQTVHPIVDMKISTGSNAEINKNTRLEWTPGELSEATVYIEVSKYDQDTATGVSIDCIVPDNGGYSFSQELISIIEENNMVGEDITFERQIADFQISNNSILTIISIGKE